MNTLSAIVFLLNIGLMAFIAYDVMKKKQPTDNSSAPEDTTESEGVPSPDGNRPEKKAGIGKSKFSMAEVRKIAERAAQAALEDAVAGEMTLDEVQFDDEPASSESNPATLDKEAMKAAFETDERIDAEVAASNGTSEPMATGSTFDELARAELILGRKTEPSTEEHQYVVRVFADFKDTQLMDHIPKYILDKLNECHRKVEELNEKKTPMHNVEPEKVKEYAEFILEDYLPKSHKH